MRIRLVALFAVLVALTGLGALLSGGAGAAPTPASTSAYPPVGPTTGSPTSGSQAPTTESTSQAPTTESTGKLPTSESAPTTPAESTATSQSAEASSESQGSQASSQAAAQNQNNSNNKSGLAFTGTPVGILLEVAAALLAVGGIALFAAKRRGQHA